jgi:hypothetical protein
MSLPEETQETISRADATKRGLKFYFTGLACKRGHIATRHLNGTCVECAPSYKEKHAAQAAERDPKGYRAVVSAAVRRHYERNRNAILDKKRAYYVMNSVSLKAKSKARREAKKAAQAESAVQP